MIKYDFACPEDAMLIRDALDALLKLVFGSANKEKLDFYKRVLKYKIKSITVYPQGTNNEYVSGGGGGQVVTNDKDGTSDVYLIGYKYARPEQYEQIKETAAHELCHVLANILPNLENNKPTVQNNIMYVNRQGRIKAVNMLNGKAKDSLDENIGVMFNETMMDIISVMTTKKFNTSNSDVFVNDVFSKRHTSWAEKGDNQSVYTCFTSLTRLAIAAFSNVGRINYGEMVNDGKGIFDSTCTMKNGTKRKANDFLYGILFNPVRIQREFDKYMGVGEYQKFCNSVDIWFVEQAMLGYHKTRDEIQQNLKKYMRYLRTFFNRKMSDYKTKGMLDQAEKIRIVNKFNEIWYDIQHEFDTYFTIEEQFGMYNKINYTRDS